MSACVGCDVRGKVTTPKSLKIEDDAFESLIRWYCREAGVRNLEVCDVWVCEA